MFIETWGNIIVSSLEGLWQGFIDFLPALVGAIVIFLIGLVIAGGLGKLAERIVRALPVDLILERLGFKEPLERAGLRLDSGKFVGGLVRWFLIIAFVLAAVDILQLNQVSAFLSSVLLYIPNIIVAVIILIAAVLVASFLERIVRAAVDASELTHGGFLATLTRWTVFIFGIFAALIQLGIAPQLMNTLFTGIIAMLAIAGGLAFGLGGRDFATSVIEKLRSDMRK